VSLFASNIADWSLLKDLADDAQVHSHTGSVLRSAGLSTIFTTRSVVTILAEYPARASRAHSQPGLSQPGLRPRPPLNINALRVNLVNIDIVDTCRG